MEKRINTIDFIRGIALIMMITYHFLWDLSYYNLGVNVHSLPIDLCGEISFSLFILVSGYCSNFSRHNLSSGLKLLLYSTIITAGSYLIIEDQIIVFGILFLMGFSKIFVNIFKKILDKINAHIGAIVNILLYISLYSVRYHYINIGFTKIILPSSLYQTNYFSFLGFFNSNFSSLDYFPIIPYLFLFLFGYYCSKIFKGKDINFIKIKSRFIEYLGRHTLIIYFTHQIVLFGIVSIIAKIIGE